MRKKNVIAAWLPQSFRQEVARALESEPDAIGWLPSMPSVEEYLIGADPPADVIVLSPQVHEADAFNMAEFVARISPAVAIVMARDQPLSGSKAARVSTEPGQLQAGSPGALYPGATPARSGS